MTGKKLKVEATAKNRAGISTALTLCKQKKLEMLYVKVLKPKKGLGCMG